MPPASALRQRLRPGLLLLALAGGAALVPLWARSDGATETDLSGTWLRDERASDDPIDKITDDNPTKKPTHTFGGGPGPGPGGGFGRGGQNVPNAPGSWFGRGGGGGRNRGRGREDESGRERLEHLAHGLSVLTIEQSASQLTIHNANRETRVLFTDGRRAGDGFGSESTVRKRAGGLVVETTTSEGRLVETYVLEDGGQRLTLDTDVSGEQWPRVQFRTVFERVEREGSSVPGEAADAGPAAEPIEATAALVPDQPGQDSDAVDEPARDRHSDPDLPRHGGAGPGEPEEEEIYGGTVIRALPPPNDEGRLLSGKVLIQTLAIEPAIAGVTFELDGEQVARRNVPPFEAKIELADPPREQTLKVAAMSADGRLLGGDVLVLNRLDPPFRVHIAAIESGSRPDTVKVKAEVSVPRKAELESVTFYRNEEQVARLGAGAGPFIADVARPSGGAAAQDYVRVVAVLADGRELEDVQLLQGGVFAEKVDVHLVQLQVLVTDKSGAPVTGLEAADFEVVDGGKTRPVERLYPSQNVALVLGLAIDSSGSMGPLWPQTRASTERFLDGTLRGKDRAFLVDFDSQLRLLQPITGERDELRRALAYLEPNGGTALYDSILFSLLQFQDEPGRRALIVVTDGFDSQSRADPSRAIEFGQRLGVPVYVIAMSERGGMGPGGPPIGRGAAGGGLGQAAMAEGLARANLRLITDPTGGRMFQALDAQQVVHAFDQIQDELRHQYVLTFYTELADGRATTPVVHVKRKGLKVKTAVPLDLAD